MHSGRMVFAQLTDLLPRKRFQTLVSRYRGDHKNRGFSCFDQLLTMIFAQLTFCESLRDIEACLCAQPAHLYHLGIRGNVRAFHAAGDANEFRDARIFEGLAQILMGAGSRFICPLRHRHRLGCRRLCLRLHHHQPLPGLVPLGQVPAAQGGCQTPHAHRLCAATYPLLSLFPRVKCTM